jgi:hypothetical protein
MRTRCTYNAPLYTRQPRLQSSAGEIQGSDQTDLGAYGVLVHPILLRATRNPSRAKDIDSPAGERGKICLLVFQILVRSQATAFDSPISGLSTEDCRGTNITMSAGIVQDLWYASELTFAGA